jgi:hypothetical protein
MERTRNVWVTRDFIVNQSLKHFFIAELVSIELEDQEGDFTTKTPLKVL